MFAWEEEAWVEQDGGMLPVLSMAPDVVEIIGWTSPTLSVVVGCRCCCCNVDVLYQYRLSSRGCSVLSYQSGDAKVSILPSPKYPEPQQVSQCQCRER